MPISRKIKFVEKQNIDNPLPIKSLFDVGLYITGTNFVTKDIFENSQNSAIVKENILTTTDNTSTFPTYVDSYSYTVTIPGQGIQQFNEFVSSSLLVNLTSDHFCSTDGYYDLNDAYYCGITEKVNSCEIKYEYNFLIEQYEKVISSTTIEEKLLPNMYAILYAKKEVDLYGKSEKFNDFVTLNNNIKFVQSNTLQTKAFTNLNNGGEYHNLYAKALEKVALLSVGGSSNFNNITGKMTNIIIPPEQLTEINKLSEYKELYPMYNEINITMDKFSSFSTLLKDSGLTLSLINYVINSSASAGDFYLSEEKVNYSFNVDTDDISEIDTSIYEQGIQTSISTELVTGSVKLYDLYNWWLLTQQDYTLNKTNQDNSIVFGIDDETVKLVEYNNQFTRNLSYVLFYGKLRKLVQQTQRNFSQVISGETAYTEAVFYKISKYKSGSSTPIQTFWIPNSANVDSLQFIDTQVKYDTNYEYKIFAYTLVIGNSITSNVTTDVKNEDITFGYGGAAITTVTRSIGIDYVTSPLITLVEVPVYNITNRIIDDAPLRPEILTIPFKNINNKIKLFFNNSTGEEEEEFYVINPDDSANQSKNIQTMFASIPKAKQKFKSDDIASGFEIYRTTKKPASYLDIQNNLLSTVTTDYDTKTFIKASSASFIDNIVPNRKYYYVFRTIDFHGNYSNPTDVYEIEMVDNDGAIYLKTEIINIKENYSVLMKNKSFKKLLLIKPEILQTVGNNMLNTLQSAYDIYTTGNASVLGDSPSPVWGKKFKLRFVSKKTGKMFDLNLQLNVEIDKENL